MSITKGYRQYRGRGRGTGGKIFLVIVLVLILLSALAYLLTRQYIVYDSDGSAHLELPFGKQEEQQEPAPNPIPDADIHIQKEEEPVPEPEELPPVLEVLHARELPYSCLNADTAKYLSESAVVINVKRYDGTISYRSEAAPDGILCGGEKTLTNLAALTDSDVYTIAKISALVDFAYADSCPEAAYSYSWGGLWQDNYDRYWLDPTEEKTRTYLCALAAECAKLGFDEILLDQLRFPIEGNLSQTDLAADTDRVEAMSSLVEEIRQAAGKSTAVSILLPLSIGTDYSFEQSGFTITTLTESFDRIYVPAYGDSWYWLNNSLPEDFDREIRLVLTGGPQDSGSYLIVQ